MKTSLISLACLSSIAALLLSPGASAQDGPPPPHPRYKLIRHNEDWSLLRDPALRTDWWDRLKYVPLSDDGEVWLSFGGEVMSRFEGWENFTLGAPPPPGKSTDDTFLLTRMRLNADLHWGENFRLWGEIKSAQATDRNLPGGRRPLDLDTIDLQELFFDWRIPTGADSSVTLRPGRQMLQFGAQRLVSPLPWGNALRTWDGVTADYVSGPLRVTALATAFAPVQKTDFNDIDTNKLLYGLYGTHTYGPRNVLDVYWLGSESDNRTFNGTTGDSSRQSVGLRRSGPLGGDFDGEVELTYQFGEVGQGDVSAYSIASQAGIRPGGGSARYWVGLDWASGDDEPGGNVETFDQLYPLGHAYFGYLDQIGRQNAVDSSLGTRWNPLKDISLAFIGHSYWVPSKQDAIYNAGGRILRAGPFESSWIGWELNATATWTPTLHFLAELGLGRFFAGDAIEETTPGGAKDSTFGYLMLRYSF